MHDFILLLQEFGIKWQVIDVVRLGFEDENKSDHLPVVLIMVDRKDVNEKCARDAVEHPRLDDGGVSI